MTSVATKQQTPTFRLRTRFHVRPALISSCKARGVSAHCICAAILKFAGRVVKDEMNGKSRPMTFSAINYRDEKCKVNHAYF